MPSLPSETMDHVKIRVNNVYDEFSWQQMLFATFVFLSLIMCGCWCLCAANQLNREEIDTYHLESEFLSDDEKEKRTKGGADEPDESERLQNYLNSLIDNLCFVKKEEVF
ncbi:unnamed protein product [Caenorhabditis sp. 36 PRJEB53466]|nr:unnamed protein product [Caenorhabditis sp. 36 PRJEB53466]